MAMRVLLPAFDTEKVPVFAGVRVSQLLAKAVTRSGCATAVTVDQLPASTRKAIDGCYGQAWCLSGIAATLSVDRIVTGTLRHAGDRYELQLLIIDVGKRHVVQSLIEKAPDRLVLLPLLAQHSAQPLCDALSGADLAITALPPAPKAGPDFATLPDAAPTPPAKMPAPPLPPVVIARTPELPPLVARPPPMVAARAAPVTKPTPPVARPPPAKVELVLARAPAKPAAPIALQTAPRPPVAHAAWLHPPVCARARLWTFASLGTGGVALAVAGGFGIGVLSALAERKASTTQEGFDTAHAAMQSRATLANVAFGVSGVALVGSAVLWFKGDAMFGDRPAKAAPHHR